MEVDVNSGHPTAYYYIKGSKSNKQNKHNKLYLHLVGLEKSMNDNELKQVNNIVKVKVIEEKGNILEYPSDWSVYDPYNNTQGSSKFVYFYGDYINKKTNVKEYVLMLKYEVLPKVVWNQNISVLTVCNPLIELASASK